MNAPGRALGHVHSTRRDGRIKVVETWYDDDPPDFKGFDVWISHQRSRPRTFFGWHYRCSLMVDLARSAPELLAAMSTTTAKLIRRSERNEEFTCRFNAAPTDEELEAFADAYDAFPVYTGHDPVDRARLKELRAAGFLHFSEVRDASGTAVVWHGVLAHPRAGVAQAWYQISRFHQEMDQDRIQAMGRANRWLYYREFLHFKELGFRFYDLNGWYTGEDDAKRLNINKFKEGFGGAGRLSYDLEEPVSLAGWAYFLGRTLKRWLTLPDQRKEMARLRRAPLRLPEGLLRREQASERPGTSAGAAAG